MPGTGYLPEVLLGGDGIDVSGSSVVTVAAAVQQVLTPADAQTQAPLLFWGEFGTENERVISADGSTLDAWVDSRENGMALSAAGAARPTFSAAGVGPFGANQRLTSAVLVPSDAEVFILAVLSGSPASSGMIATMSDTGADNRSTMYLDDGPGFRVVRYAGLSSAFYPTPTGLGLDRAAFDAYSRGLWRAGIYKTDEYHAAAAVRSPTVLGVGNYLVANVPFVGRIKRLAMWLGTPSDYEIDRLEALWSAEESLPAPPGLWPPPTVVPVGDPRLILPADLWALQGEPVELWRQAIHYRTGLTPQALTSPTLGDGEDPRYPDRFRFEAPPLGDHEITVMENGYANSSVLHVIPPLPASATPHGVIFTGDSITAEGTEVRRVRDFLGGASIVNLMGSLTIDGVKQEGRAGWTWTLFDSVGSPFFNGGGALDFAGYFAAVGTPSCMVWRLGTNDFNATDATIAAAIATAFGHAENIIAASQAVVPTLVHVIGTPFPGDGDPAGWVGGEATRLQFLRCMNAATAATFTQFGGREATGVYVMWSIGHIDPMRGYRGPTDLPGIHPNRLWGDRELARADAARLTSIWPNLV